jgi:hypothetical protein
VVQIVLGLTSGVLCVLYSPQTSLNGAKLLLNKGPAKRPTVEDMSDAVAAPAIIVPGVTRDGEFTSGLPNKRKRDKERQDPRKSHRPELPVQGPGRGGRVGASATQHVVQNLVRDTTRDEDVRVPFFFIFLSYLCFCVSLLVVVVPAIVRFGQIIGQMIIQRASKHGECRFSNDLCSPLGRRKGGEVGSRQHVYLATSLNRRGDAASDALTTAE